MTTLDFLVKFMQKDQGGGVGNGGNGSVDVTSIAASTGDFAIIALIVAAILAIGIGLVYAYYKKRQMAFSTMAHAKGTDATFLGAVKQNPKTCAIFAIVAVLCLCAAFLFGGVKNAIAESSHDGFSATDVEYYYEESDNTWYELVAALVNENVDASDAKITSLHIEKNPEANDNNIKWQIGNDEENPWYNGSISTSADIQGLDVPFSNDTVDEPLYIHADSEGLTNELCDSLAGKSLFTITANIESLGLYKAQAIDTLTAARDLANDEINALPLLDDDQKAEHIKQIENEYNIGCNNIYNVKDFTSVETSLNNAKTAIQDIVDSAKLKETKKEAKYTLEGSATSAMSQIYSLEKLSNERKQFYSNQVGEAFNAGCNNIDNATLSEDVEIALNNAKGDIEDIVGAAKKEAVNDAYAYLTEGTDGNTMHFAYDDQSDKRGKSVYSLNNFTTDNEINAGKFDYPGWLDNDSEPIIKFNSFKFDDSFASYKPETVAYWFSGQENLTINNNSFKNLDLSCCRDMSYMFCNSSITNFSSSWLTGNVDKLERFAGVFYHCISLETCDLTKIDLQNLSSCLAISNLFYSCTSLKTVICKQNLSGYTETGGKWVFAGCDSIKGGNETTYNENFINAEYARPDGGTDSPGYFTNIDTPSTYKPIQTTLTDGSNTYTVNFLPAITDASWKDANINFYKKNADETYDKLNVSSMSSLAKAIKDIDSSKEPTVNAAAVYTDATGITFYGTINTLWNEVFELSTPRSALPKGLTESMKILLRGGKTEGSYLYKTVYFEDNDDTVPTDKGYWTANFAVVRDNKMPNLDGVGYHSFYSAYYYGGNSSLLSSRANWAWSSHAFSTAHAYYWEEEHSKWDHQSKSIYSAAVLSQDF